MVALQALVASGEEGGETFFDNLWLSGAMLVAAASAIAATIVGWIAIVRKGERSLPVMFTVAIGTLVTLFVLGELTTPH